MYTHVGFAFKSFSVSVVVDQNSPTKKQQPSNVAGEKNWIIECQYFDKNFILTCEYLKLCCNKPNLMEMSIVQCKIWWWINISGMSH